MFTDDRRRVVNAGVRHGRDAQIASMRSLAEIGANVTWTVMATRGERLILSRVRSLNRDLRHGEFDAEMLAIIEIDADNRIAATLTIDPDDIDAAFEELDARYLAGEAAAHAHTWSVISRGLRRTQPTRTRRDDAGLGEHRPPTRDSFAPGEMTAYVRASWDRYSGPQLPHRGGASAEQPRSGLLPWCGQGPRKQGFDAEWRMIDLMTVEGDLISRCELFDEADLDAALAGSTNSVDHAARKRRNPDLGASRRCIQPPRFGWFSRPCWCGRSIRR